MKYSRPTAHIVRDRVHYWLCSWNGVGYPLRTAPVGKFSCPHHTGQYGRHNK